MKKLIEIKNIVKDFDGQRVLNGISLDIHENEFVTLLGPSGCGKTTLLRIIAGFLDADDGQVLFDGKDISGLPPYKREVNTVFQKYALFPHLNVYDNIAFGLNLKKQPKDIIEQKVKRMLRLVGLSGFDKRRITQMSSVLPLPARWSTNRRFCCSTSRSAHWISSCARKCSAS